MADQNFNVWNSFTQGMGLADNFRRMQDDERQRRMLEKQDAAMRQLSEQGYIPGYEGVQGAEMVPWLRDTFQSNPELALKLGNQAALPFAMDRDVKKAGEVERMKKESDAAVAMKMARSMGFMPPEGAGSVLAPPEGGGMAVPGQGGFLSPLAIDAGPGHSGLSRMMKMTPQGPTFELSQLPPHQIQNDLDMRAIDRERIGLDRDKYGLDKEKQVDERAKSAATLAKTDQDMRLNAGQRVESLMKGMHEIQAKVQAGEISPGVANQALGPMKAQLDQALREQHDVTRGLGKIETNVENFAGERKAAADPRLQSSVEAAPSLKPSAPMKAAAPASPTAAGPQVGAGLPYKQQVEVQQKATQQKVDLSTKSIQDAHAAADKFNSHMPSINRLFDLVGKKELGNRFMGNMPAGEPMLRMYSQDNDELQKLRNELIDTQKQEGQSQLMNTLPELAIQSDALPSVTNSPDVNKRSMVNLRNLADARLAAPGFLENWAQQHGGTIDGARQAFREWMQHNPLYKATETNGRVSVGEHDGYIPIDAWTRLKQRFSTKEIVRKRDEGNIQVINGRVFFKE